MPSLIINTLTLVRENGGSGLKWREVILKCAGAKIINMYTSQENIDIRTNCSGFDLK